MTSITIHTIPGLDQAARGLAWLASWASPVRGAGIFWISGAPGFWRAWTEPGAWTAQLGRLQVVVDMTRMQTRGKAA